MTVPRTAVLLILLSGAAVPGATAQQFIPPIDSGLARWARAHAVPLPPVARPFEDADYAWLGPAVGQARVIAVGENIHDAHEPLALRNHLIRYAVRHLGVTGVALESGFTEGVAVDRFVQGGPGEVDSVLRAGLTSGFDRLPENRELVLWLREHNRTARRKVHYYGLDQSGVNGEYDGRVGTEGALAALAATDSTLAGRFRTRLAPLLDRFEVPRFGTLSVTERLDLRQRLADLEAALSRATDPDPDRKALGIRLGWAARRVYDANVSSLGGGSRAAATIRLRDSVMAENALWMLERTPPGERILIHAHNGHVMDVPMTLPVMGPPIPMTGHRLRAALGRELVVIATSSAVFEDLGPVPADLSSLEAALARLATPNYAIDLRTADREPEVRDLLSIPWITRIHLWLQPIVPRSAADVMVVLDRVVRTTHLR